jgi:hypothetical protein
MLGTLDFSTRLARILLQIRVNTLAPGPTSRANLSANARRQKSPARVLTPCVPRAPRISDHMLSARAVNTAIRRNKSRECPQEHLL